MADYRNSILADTFETTVYHSGDFKYKAETMGEITGSRSTGFFGTGYYFVRNPERLSAGSYGERPIYSFDISRYRMILGTRKVHDALKNMDAYVSQYPIMQTDLKTLKHIAREFEGSFYIPQFSHKTVIDLMEDDYDEDSYDNDFRNYIEDEFPTLLEEHDSIDELSAFMDVFYVEYPDWDAIRNEYSLVRHLLSTDMVDYYLGCKNHIWRDCLELDIDEDVFESLAEDIYHELEPYYVDGFLQIWNSVIDKQDSIPTRILKRLGYEGVYPSTECDNTTYGGCIYSLDKIGNLKGYNESAKGTDPLNA